MYEVDVLARYDTRNNYNRQSVYNVTSVYSEDCSVFQENCVLLFNLNIES